MKIKLGFTMAEAILVITFRYHCNNYDINDDEAPNVLGKDIFILPLNKNGIMYAE